MSVSHSHELGTAAGILLDIEGTTSSISFVYDQMFPFVRRELSAFLADQWQRAEVQDACRQIAHDAGFASLEAWCRAADRKRRPRLDHPPSPASDGRRREGDGP